MLPFSVADRPLYGMVISAGGDVPSRSVCTAQEIVRDLVCGTLSVCQSIAQTQQNIHF